MNYLNLLIENWRLILLLFVVFDLFLLIIIYKKRRLKSLSRSDKKFVLSHWEEIMELASSSPNQAIIEADKMLDFVLKKHGFVGSVADKLKASESRYSDYQGLWRAHKTRNRIAHEMGVQIGSYEARGILKSFERALKDLGAM